VERPEIAPVVCEGAQGEHHCLRHYLDEVRRRGLAGAEFNAEGVSSMLLGALFADAMMRDMMPPSLSVDDMVRDYVHTTLVAIGAVSTSTPGVV
jgi:hypothetical protein